MRIRDLEAVETPEITREHIEKIIASGASIVLKVNTAASMGK